MYKAVTRVVLSVKTPLRISQKTIQKEETYLVCHIKTLTLCVEAVA